MSDKQPEDFGNIKVEGENFDKIKKLYDDFEEQIKIIEKAKNKLKIAHKTLWLEVNKMYPQTANIPSKLDMSNDVHGVCFITPDKLPKVELVALDDVAEAAGE